MVSNVGTSFLCVGLVFPFSAYTSGALMSRYTPKEEREGGYHPRVSHGVVTFTSLYTHYKDGSLRVISESKNNPRLCICRRRIVYGFKVWGSFFCPQIVFSLTNVFVRSVSFDRNNQSITTLMKTLNSRVYGRFLIGPFIWKDSYRKYPDDTNGK